MPCTAMLMSTASSARQFPCTSAIAAILIGSPLQLRVADDEFGSRAVGGRENRAIPQTAALQAVCAGSLLTVLRRSSHAEETRQAKTLTPTAVEINGMSQRSKAPFRAGHS